MDKMHGKSIDEAVKFTRGKVIFGVLSDSKNSDVSYKILKSQRRR